MAEYQHVMYTSKSVVEQVYSELYGDVDRVEIEQGSRLSGSVRGKLGSFLSMISGSFSGEVTESEIHTINYDDDMRQAKKLANSILTDESVPTVSDLGHKGVNQNQLFRFSCEVSTVPFESEIDGDTYIEVSGETGGVTFRGETSTENWGTRSHIIQSVRAAKRGEEYPYQGLLWPISEVSDCEYDVKFVIICGPEVDLRDEWFDNNI